MLAGCDEGPDDMPIPKELLKLARNNLSITQQLSAYQGVVELP